MTCRRYDRERENALAEQLRRVLVDRADLDAVIEARKRRLERKIMARTKRITASLPSELVRQIERIDSNRIAFIGRAIERELAGRRAHYPTPPSGADD